MIHFLKVLASILMVLSGLVFLVGVVEQFGGRGEEVVQGVTTAGMAVMSVLLAGAVWLLADLAEMAHQRS